VGRIPAFTCVTSSFNATQHAPSTMKSLRFPRWLPAKARGATQAMMCVNAAWGSNWLGTFDEEQRMDAFDRQYRAWAEAGIPVARHSTR
jgi:hypothetical protein